MYGFLPLQKQVELHSRNTAGCKLDSGSEHEDIRFCVAKTIKCISQAVLLKAIAYQLVSFRFWAICFLNERKSTL